MSSPSSSPGKNGSAATAAAGLAGLPRMLPPDSLAMNMTNLPAALAFPGLDTQNLLNYFMANAMLQQQQQHLQQQQQTHQQHNHHQRLQQQQQSQQQLQQHLQQQQQQAHNQHHNQQQQHTQRIQHHHQSQSQQQQPPQQQQQQQVPSHRRAYNPAATLHYLATNECRVIDYRGHRIAAFLSTPNPAMMHHLARLGQPAPKPNQSEFLLCLPQAFEVFLKHLVGGLHTVYTKLKRLDIIPIVCNVEQVRILRGLGAIQPGVNRCKLLSAHDFDILFKDCTTASISEQQQRGKETTRTLGCEHPDDNLPGRPPKRSPVGDMLSSASGSPARDDSRTPSPTIDSGGSAGGLSHGNSNRLTSNSNLRHQHLESQQNSLTNASSLVSALTNAATFNNGGSPLLHGGHSGLSAALGLNNNNLQQQQQQQTIDLSALTQHLSNLKNSSNINNNIISSNNDIKANPLNNLFNPGLLANKLAQQQLLGAATATQAGANSKSNNSLRNVFSSGSNNGTSTSPVSTTTTTQPQLPHVTSPSAASAMGPTLTGSLNSLIECQTAGSPVATNLAATTNTTSAAVNPALSPATAAAAAASNMYLNPNMLQDVCLLLAVVQQQLSLQQQQAAGLGQLAPNSNNNLGAFGPLQGAGPGAAAANMLQHQLRAQLQLLQQQQQQLSTTTASNAASNQAQLLQSSSEAEKAQIATGNKSNELVNTRENQRGRHKRRHARASDDSDSESALDDEEENDDDDAADEEEEPAEVQRPLKKRTGKKRGKYNKRPKIEQQQQQQHVAATETSDNFQASEAERRDDDSHKVSPATSSRQPPPPVEDRDLSSSSSSDLEDSICYNNNSAVASSQLIRPRESKKRIDIGAEGPTTNDEGQEKSSLGGAATTAAAIKASSSGDDDEDDERQMAEQQGESEISSAEEEEQEEREENNNNDLAEVAN